VAKKTTAGEKFGTVWGYMLFPALGMVAVAWILRVLEIGKAASWTLLQVFYPLIGWGAVVVAAIVVLATLDIITLIRRRIAQRKALRAAMEGES
jgi:hypothetical protein